MLHTGIVSKTAEQRLIYEGHDLPKIASCPNPKLVDQPGVLPSGKFTQNGKFHEAAQKFKNGKRAPERVRVYEKIRSGIWSYNGVFHLVDAWHERDEHRAVYKFKLVAVEGDEDFAQPVHMDAERRRIIPTASNWKFGSETVESAGYVKQKTNCTLITSFHSQRVEHHSQPRMSSSCARVTICRNEITSNEMMNLRRVAANWFT